LSYENHDAINKLYHNKKLSADNLVYSYTDYEKQLIDKEFSNIYNPPIFFSDAYMDAQVYLWTTDDIIHVIFRGTTSFKDILINMDLSTITINDVHIHRGFYEQFMSIQHSLTRELFRLLDTNKFYTVLFQGHSLGGALSQIACVFYKEHFSENIKIKCCTFGCPRTGDIKFSKLFEKSVDENYRITNNNDPVSMIPMHYIWNHTYNTNILLQKRHLGINALFYYVVICIAVRQLTSIT
jgi:hypothetical protein